jgi:hypothetical protein
VVRHEDFAHDPAEGLDVLNGSERALNTGELTGDIRAVRRHRHCATAGGDEEAPR